MSSNDDGKYLKDLIARIRAPKLDGVDIWFFMGPIFLIPRLHNIIGSAGKLKLLEHADMAWRSYVVFDLLSCGTS